jgi:hypothetical protein
LIFDNLKALLTDFSRFVLTHDSNVQIESSSKVWEISEDDVGIPHNATSGPL